MDWESTVYDVTLADNHTETVRASGYVQEGPLTTFFSSARRRSTIDSLSERVASFRTADIRRILRRDPRPLHALTIDGEDDTPAAFEATAGVRGEDLRVASSLPGSCRVPGSAAPARR
jgi:hypothetical protein